MTTYISDLSERSDCASSVVFVLASHVLRQRRCHDDHIVSNGCHSLNHKVHHLSQIHVRALEQLGHRKEALRCFTLRDGFTLCPAVKRRLIRADTVTSHARHDPSTMVGLYDAFTETRCKTQSHSRRRDAHVLKVQSHPNVSAATQGGKPTCSNKYIIFANVTMQSFGLSGMSLNFRDCKRWSEGQ